MKILFLHMLKVRVRSGARVARMFFALAFSPSDGQHLTSEVRCWRGEGLSTVWMPKLDYLKNSRFWEKVKRIGYWDDVPEELLNAVASKLESWDDYEQLGRSSKLLVQNQQEKWNRAQNEIFEAICAVLPDARGRINQLIIHPTLFVIWNLG